MSSDKLIQSVPLRAFLAGSAYPVLFFPFALLSLSSMARPESEFSLGSVIWFFPWAMGLWNVLFLRVRPRLPGTWKTQYWLWGILLGTLFPIVGNLNNVPGKLWGLEFPYGLAVIPAGMLAYGLVWRYAVRFLNRVVGVDKT